MKLPLETELYAGTIRVGDKIQSHTSTYLFNSLWEGYRVVPADRDCLNQALISGPLCRGCKFANAIYDCLKSGQRERTIIERQNVSTENSEGNSGNR